LINCTLVWSNLTANADWQEFARFDRDGSGTIDAEELGILMKSFGTEMDEEDVENLLKQADKDSSGEITFEEWLDFMGVASPDQSHADHGSSASGSIPVHFKTDEEETLTIECLCTGKESFNNVKDEVERQLDYRIASLKYIPQSMGESYCTVVDSFTWNHLTKEWQDDVLNRKFRNMLRHVKFARIALENIDDPAEVTRGILYLWELMLNKENHPSIPMELFHTMVEAISVPTCYRNPEVGSAFAACVWTASSVDTTFREWLVDASVFRALEVLTAVSGDEILANVSGALISIAEAPRGLKELAKPANVSALLNLMQHHDDFTSITAAEALCNCLFGGALSPVSLATHMVEEAHLPTGGLEDDDIEEELNSVATQADVAASAGAGAAETVTPAEEDEDDDSRLFV